MSGAFDLFHHAHYKALKTASSLGDTFIVQVDGDLLVKKRKGAERLYLAESERAEIIASLEFVDYVFISNLPAENKITLKSVNPNIFIRAILPQELDQERIRREIILMKKIPRGKIVWLKQTSEISTTKLLSVVDKAKDNVINNRIQISIGIAAYNAQENIKQLLDSLLRQKKIKNVAEIIIHSDGSTDNTVEIVRQIKSDVIKIIDSEKRTGFAGSVEAILRRASSEVVILLNDDIKITDSQFIEKLIEPFTKEPNIGLISGNPQPLPAKTFVEKAVISSFRAYEEMGINLRNGHNHFTCDGKVLVLSRRLIDSLAFPSDYKQIGNVDTFLYFSCLTNGFKYRHVKEAKVLYRCPSNIKDYIKSTTRNNSQFYLLKKSFGNLLEKEYQIPKSIYKYYFKEFLKNPIGCLFIFITGVYVKIKAKSFEKTLTSTWDVVGSTKKLSEAQHV